MLRQCSISDLNKINFFLSELGCKTIEEDDLINNLHQYYVYQKNNLIIGFIGYSIYYDRAELDYLYVIEKYRKKGIGNLMLDYLINLVKEKCTNISLEVNTSNISAINLYKKKGFKCAKVITNYYQNEDGFLMIKELD